VAWGVAVGGAGVSVGKASGLFVWQADRTRQKQQINNKGWTIRMVYWASVSDVSIVHGLPSIAMTTSCSVVV
jgi:hypothetical protein